jgi:hypothetical protein
MNGGIQPTVELATNQGYGYGYGNGGFFGSEGIWAIVLLALLFNNGWGGGFGGNGFNNIATTDYISSEFTQRDVTSGTQSVLTALNNGFSDAATNTCNLRSDVLTGNMGLQNSILDSKYAAALGNANTQRDVLMQTTQLENQLSNVALSNQAHIDSCCCEIKSLIREDGDKTRALITENTIQDLRDRLTAAKDVISDQRTESNIVNALRPYPVPAYLTGSPYIGFNNGFYGGGFYGNTIV